MAALFEPAALAFYAVLILPEHISMAQLAFDVPSTVGPANTMGFVSLAILLLIIGNLGAPDVSLFQAISNPT